jgi:hypothetical protein
MPKTLVAGAVLAVLIAPVSASADEPAATRTRVTIRGDGDSVVIERSTVPAGKPSRAAEWASGPIGAAVDMKAAGASDAQVIAYLQAHAEELPTVIASEDVRRLRKAGAGKRVVDYLARVSAVDIGETGEGHEVVEYAAAPSPGENYSEEWAPGVPYYGNYVGGYGGAYPGRFRGLGHRDFHVHAAPLARQTSLPRVHVAPRPAAAPHATFSRIPMQ